MPFTMTPLLVAAGVLAISSQAIAAPDMAIPHRTIARQIRPITQGTTPNKLATSCTDSSTPRCVSLEVYTSCQGSYGLWQYEAPPNIVCANDQLIFASDLAACPSNSGSACTTGSCTAYAFQCEDKYKYGVCNSGGNLTVHLETVGGETCREQIGSTSPESSTQNTTNSARDMQHSVTKRVSQKDNAIVAQSLCSSLS